MALRPFSRPLIPNPPLSDQLGRFWYVFPSAWPRSPATSHPSAYPVESYCVPDFDSPSIFARILDKDKGGHFSITPAANFSTKQSYLPSSNVCLLPPSPDLIRVNLLPFRSFKPNFSTRMVWSKLLIFFRAKPPTTPVALSCTG